MEATNIQSSKKSNDGWIDGHGKIMNIQMSLKEKEKVIRQ